MKVIGIIPARYASSRFPGKPLQLIHGKSMINRVYTSTIKSPLLTKVIVATDDQRIYNHVSDFGGEVLMTSSDHQSGTDRCNEVIETLEKKKEFYDLVVNIQGDEPFIDISQFDQVLGLFTSESIQISSLAKEIHHVGDLNDSNVVKVIFDQHKKAIYFSRFPIPYQRGKDKENWLAGHKYYKHIGLYAFRTEILKQICSLKRSSLEVSESLEQLRWLENGYPIHIEVTDIENISIDTPADLEKLTNNF